MEKSFWDNNSDLTVLNNQLFERLVPAMGEAHTTHGELLRCMCKLYYDCYNNGGCNMSVLTHQLDCVEGHRQEIIAKMKDAQAFDRFMNVLREHAVCGDMYLPRDWSKEDLEDIIEAVVKLVAEIEGVSHDYCKRF